MTTTRVTSPRRYSRRVKTGPASPVTRALRTLHARLSRPALITLISIAAIVVVVALVVGITAITTLFRQLGAQAPAPGTPFVVLAESAAAEASTTSSGTAQAAAEYLAAEPTAYWLTPERDPIGSVGERVRGLADEARTQRATLALVVYGLPERDCGNHSAGGLDAADYPVWIDEIAAALVAARDVRVVLVLEPDSLSLAGECGNLAARVPQLQSAVSALQRTDVFIYLDGGHSNWHPAAEQAQLLQAVGLDGVRGFSLNVSNFNPAADEVAYAHAVSAALGGGAHALIDTSRSGAGSDGQWCNPPGRLVGEASASFGDDVVDTNLWIKPPGESDGPCNGGPAAGDWWPAAAIELTRAGRG